MSRALVMLLQQAAHSPNNMMARMMSTLSQSSARPQHQLRNSWNSLLLVPNQLQLRGFAGLAPPESAVQKGDQNRHVGEPGQDTNYNTGYVAPHPSMPITSIYTRSAADLNPLNEAHIKAAYDFSYLETIKPSHVPPKDLADRVGLTAVRFSRWTFDTVTGYGPKMTEASWLTRIIFLETVAGVPGMVSGMLRHLHSLRLMRRDKGWIPCLLEEAENERMHLLTFFEIRKPSVITRSLVLLAQGIFFNFYFIAYLLWPKACHAFVGYLEEEAVRTYTHALRDIDEGKLWAGRPAPSIAQQYWGLKPEATMRDVILCVRADEACHSHVNHTLKSVKATDPNPFSLGKTQLP